jgi:transposase
MIHVGVDLHQAFCYMTALDSTGRALKAGPVANEGWALRRWLQGFPEPVMVAVEACSFWPAFKDAVEGEVEQIQLVHPQRVKAIAAAKLKNDRVDSLTLAHLSRCDLLPRAWMADRHTRERRQQVRLRISLGQHRASLKNQVHAILHQHGLDGEGRWELGRRCAGFSAG